MSRPSLSSNLGVSSVQNVTKARELMKKGKELITTGVFRWKADWDQASVVFTDAAKFFRLAGPEYALSQIEALEQSAVCFEKMSSHNTAARNLEAAADEASKIRGEAKRACALYQRASYQYKLNEHPDKSAAVLVKAAKALGDNGDEESRDAATEMFMQSITVFEEEDRGKFSNDTFKMIIGWLLKNERPRQCLEVLKRQAAIYQKVGGFEAYLHKNFLAIVVMDIYLDLYDEAEADHKQNQTVGRYATSEECEVASELIEAMCEASNDKLQTIIKKQIFTFLDTEIARCAKRLRFDLDKLKNRKGLAADASGDADPYGLK